MNVIITNGFGLTANVGDHALLTATVNLVRSALPAARISVLPWQIPSAAMQSSFARLTASFTSVELLDAMLPANSVGRGFPHSSPIERARIIAWTAGVNLKAEVQARVPALAGKGSPFEAIQQADLVILRGCNIVQRGRDLRTVATIRRVTFPIAVAKRAGRQIALLNISVGPVQHPIARSMVKSILKNADYVSTREPFSDEYLRDFARCSPISSADSAFAFPYIQKDADSYDPMLLGVNLLSRGEYLTAVRNSGQTYEYVMQRMAAELNELMTRVPALKVLAIPHEMDIVPLTSDLVSLRDLVSRLEHPERVQIMDSANDPLSVIRAYERCALSLGMRFHGYVLASLATTPVLGIDLDSRKVSGIAKALGMSEWMIKLEDNRALVEQVGQALQNTHELRTVIAERCASLRNKVFDNFAAYARSLAPTIAR